MCENLDKLTELMREVFDDETLEIGPETGREDVAEWDSFAHIHLCAAFERAFGVKLTTAQALSIQTAGDFLALLQ